MSCKIIRKKLITHGTMTFGGSGGTKWGKKEWRTEECGTPIFPKTGEDRTIKRKVCDTCLSGDTQAQFCH